MLREEFASCGVMAGFIYGRKIREGDDLRWRKQA